MNGSEFHILLVEDNPADAELTSFHLERGDVRASVSVVDTQEQLESALRAGSWDIVITDHSLPRMTSLDVVRIVHEVDGDIPCVIVSGRIGEEAAVQAMRAGAADYLSKDQLSFLPLAVEREVRDARHRRARRQAEQELQESQRQMIQVFESISEGFLAIDQSWRVKYVNPRVEELFGKSAMLLRDRFLWEALPELPEESLRPVLESTLWAGEKTSVEVYLRADHRWLEVRGYPAEDGAALYLLDVTERKEAEERQRELLQQLEYEHSRLQAILEQLPSAVLALDLPDGKLSLTNSRATEIWGRPLPRNSGIEDVHQWLYAGAPDVVDRDDCPIVRSAEGGEIVWDEEFRIAGPDGRDHYLSFNSAPVWSQDGERLAVVASATDITEYREVIAALEEREELLRLVIDTLPVGLWIVDVNGERVASNPVADEIFGMPGLIPKDPNEYFDVRNLETALPVVEWSFMRTVRTGEPWIGEFLELRRRDGERRMLISSTVPVKNGHGTVVAAVVVHQDVTELRHAQMLQQEAEERYQRLIEHMPAVTYISEPWPPNTVTYISPQIEELVGFTPEQIQARDGHWSLIATPENQDRLLAERSGSRASDHPPYLEYEMLTASGESVWVRDDAALLRDEHGVPLYWQGVLLDITERRGLEEQLLHQAFHDPLTGLANRALFADRVEHGLLRLSRSRTGLAVLFIDLDNFKVVNDSLGHSAGDDLVKQAAERILGSLRAGDTAARMGGDEFTILIEGVDSPQAAIDLANRILRSFKQPFILNDREVYVTPSIGVRHTESPDETPETVLRDADLAMYRAKHNGRARVELFERSMTDYTYERFEIEADLHRAIRDQEFELHYQPILSFSTGRAHAVEALLRWNHPTRGHVSPAQFIQVAEDSGLIVEVGALALNLACRQLVEWDEGGAREAGLRIWVNVSGKQLMDPDFVAVVRRAIEDHAVDPSRLGLEITESTMMENVQEGLSCLNQLRELGIVLAIDDFGTGYSSLAVLRQFPVTTLKIDRSFVAGLINKSEDHVIVAGILSLADALGLEVIAEGIEEQEQLDGLRSLGCDVGQGYYLARPAPIDRLRDVLQESASVLRAVSEKSGHGSQWTSQEHGHDLAPTVPQTIDAIQQEYLQLALDGEQRTALALVDAVIQQGIVTPAEVCLSVVQPALYEIGKRWERGDVTVAHEHMATLISEIVVQRMCQQVVQESSGASRLLLAGVQGEEHSVGARIVAGILNHQGYDVMHVGANVPHASLVEFVRDAQPHAILLSVTMPSNRNVALHAVHRLRMQIGHDIPILIGGQGMTDREGPENAENVFVTPTIADAVLVLAETIGVQVPEDAYQPAT